MGRDHDKEVLEKLEKIERTLRKIEEKENYIMAQIDELNTAIAAEDVEIQDLMASIVKVDADIDKLIAQIAAGGVPTDLTAQLRAIAAHTTSLTSGVAQLNADDVKANTPPLVGVPVITSVMVASGIVGQPFSYQVTATNSPTSYTQTGLDADAGLSFNATTGLISGTPVEASSFNVTITATNAKGSGSAVLALTTTAS